MKNYSIKNIHIEDEDVLQTLSEIGVYITNYITGDTLSSNKWMSIPKHFSPKTGEPEYLEYIHKDDRESLLKSFLDVTEGRSSNFNEIYRLLQPDGSYKWIKSVGKTVKKSEDGKPILFIGSDTDITDLKKVESDLKQRADELETLREILKVINSSLDLDRTIRRVLVEIAKLIPYETCSIQLLKGDKLEVIGAEGFSNNDDVCTLSFRYPESGSLSTHALQYGKPYLTNNVPEDFPSFTQIDDYIPIVSWIGIPLIAQGGIVGLLALDGYRSDHFNSHHLELCSIIGDHVAIALENALLHRNAFKLAMEDSLTGIGSRHRVKIEGRLIFEAAIRNKKKLSLVLVDLDKFKQINDEFGHDAGDIILKDFTKICGSEIRGFDLLGRYGGDEFIIIMPETDSEQATQVMERIREKVSLNIHSEVNRVLTFSCGICTGIPDKNSNNMSYFISTADKELYKVKLGGRNNISTHAIY